MFSRLRGTGLKTRLLHPHDEWWDRRLGVHTFGFRPAVGDHAQDDWRADYVPTPYRKIFRVLRHVGLGAGDVYVDMGCGLGRTVFAASWLGARRAVGVEIDPGLAAAAAANRQRRRLVRGEVEFVCSPAEQHAVDDVSVLYLFHPFGAGTLRTVLQQIQASLVHQPRRLRVVYENPVHTEVLDAQPWLQRAATWPAQQQSGSAYAVHFWQSAAG